MAEESGTDAPLDEVQETEEVELVPEDAVEQNQVDIGTEIEINDTVADDLPLEEMVAYEEPENNEEVVEIEDSQEVEGVAESSVNEEAELVDAEEQHDGGFAA